MRNRRPVFLTLLFVLLVSQLQTQTACADGIESVKNSALARYSVLAANFPPPEIEATAWGLLEVRSGWLVAGQNADQPLPPASITKLMTNYVLFDLLRQGKLALGDQVSISEAAWRAEGSRMFADVNTKIELGHLLKSTIIQSGNDAAIALAEHAAGSEAAFTRLMNQAAARLDLKQSVFMNSTGLPMPGHQMSAADIARLSAAIVAEFPDYFSWYAEKNYTHNGITQYNRNKLLWQDESIDGLKTGHTEAAGYCLVGTAKRDDQRWVAVVLGAADERSREQAVLSLLNYAFAAYHPVAVLDQQGGVTEVPVYGGEADSVRLQAQGSATVVVPVGREQDIAIQYQTSPYYQAPIRVGQAMGLANVLLDRKLIADVPLVAMSEIRQGSWWKRLLDTVRLKFEQLLAE